MAFGGYKNGGFILMDCFQSAEWTSGNTIVDAYQSDWQNDFLSMMAETRSELAEPCFYNRKPALKGYLKPKGEPFADEDHTWIYLFKDGYKIVHIDDLNPPTDEQYNKVFRSLFNKYVPVIKSREKGSKVIKGERVYITDEEKYFEVKFEKRKPLK